MLLPRKILNSYTLRMLLRLFSATNTLLQTYLYAGFMKLAIAHGDLFTRVPVNLTWAEARVCPGVAMPLPASLKSSPDTLNGMM